MIQVGSTRSPDMEPALVSLSGVSSGERLSRCIRRPNQSSPLMECPISSRITTRATIHISKQQKASASVRRTTPCRLHTAGQRSCSLRGSSMNLSGSGRQTSSLRNSCGVSQRVSTRQTPSRRSTAVRAAANSARSPALLRSPFRKEERPFAVPWNCRATPDSTSPKNGRV
jgi:hypothetical protein